MYVKIKWYKLSKHSNWVGLHRMLLFLSSFKFGVFWLEMCVYYQFLLTDLRWDRAKIFYSCFTLRWQISSELFGARLVVDWSGLPFPPPGDLSDPGIEPTSLTPSALAGLQHFEEKLNEPPSMSPPPHPHHIPVFPLEWTTSREQKFHFVQLQHPQHLEQWQVHKRCSVNI